MTRSGLLELFMSVSVNTKMTVIWEGLINEDSFKVSSDYMWILIQEPEMKS